MQFAALILICCALAVCAQDDSEIKPQCPGKCLTVRCGAYPVCKKDEVLVEPDYDCICCPYCRPAKCDPTFCDRVRCMSPEMIMKRCEEEGLVFVPRDPKVCNCCGKCVKKEDLS